MLLLVDIRRKMLLNSKRKVSEFTLKKDILGFEESYLEITLNTIFTMFRYIKK